MTPKEAAYVRGVAVADPLLAKGLPIVGVASLDAGEAFGLALHIKGAVVGLQWPVDAPADEVERDIRRVLEEAA